MNDSFKEALKVSFQDKDTRYAYAESSLNTRIAAQIRVIREQRGLTQAEAASLCGIRQAGYSRFEDINHDNWKTGTLWKIAQALGVRLHVSFETFGSLIQEKGALSRQYLERPSFAEDSVPHLDDLLSHLPRGASQFGASIANYSDSRNLSSALAAWQRAPANELAEYAAATT
jgi:transcriptional regulator with XRE-family HTH domain